MVPIHPDGSAYFEVPADTPIFSIRSTPAATACSWIGISQAPGLSRHRSPRRALPSHATGYMSGRPGEVKACYGCHAPQTTAVPNVAVEALRHGPGKIVRTSTNLEYRRNDPEGTQTAAHLGEAGKYRSWLRSRNATQRQRACEMLMYIEDSLNHERRQGDRDGNRGVVTRRQRGGAPRCSSGSDTPRTVQSRPPP